MYQKQKALEKYYFTFLQWTNNWRLCNDLLDAVNDESNMAVHKFTIVFGLENEILELMSNFTIWFILWSYFQNCILFRTALILQMRY